MAILSLNEFRSSEQTQFSKGTWTIKYHDETHLSDGSYLSLGYVKIEKCCPKRKLLISILSSTVKNWKNASGTNGRVKRGMKKLIKSK